MITFDDFAKLDIRIGTVISVEKVADADKLLKFVFDFGEEKRQIVSGIAGYFPDFDKLVGKQMPVLVNLESRKFKGEESQGMILVADSGDKLVLLSPDEKVPEGTKIH